MTIFIKYVTTGSIVNVYAHNPYDSSFDPTNYHTATVTAIYIINQSLDIRWTIRNDIQTIFINQVHDKFDINDNSHCTRSRFDHDIDTIIIGLKSREEQDDFSEYISMYFNIISFVITLIYSYVIFIL